jgi:hypothetical protein
MALPFGEEEFIDVFTRYNHSIWPMQIVAYLLGILIIYFVYRKFKSSFSILSVILGFLWIWTGIVYQIMFFSIINNIALFFGIIFVIQGILFIGVGLKYKDTKLDNSPNLYTGVGTIIIIYSMLIYPTLGYLFGHGYPNAPMFGVAPCPLTIFTIGILLFIDYGKSRYLLIIPLLWSIIGFNAAISLSIYEDIGLLISGLTGAILIYFKPKIIAYFHDNSEGSDESNSEIRVPYTH